MKRTRSPENTARTERENPVRMLLEAMSYGASGAIERMERRGQQELVESDVLPTDSGGTDGAFIALGFRFGPSVEGDPLFRTATLPSGWKREGSDHAMHSYIVDERGIKRVDVFYKAASYDRRADMHILNVGAAAGNEALYGDQTPTAESLRLALLTPSETADLRKSLERMRASIAEHPDIYGKYAANLAACDLILSQAPTEDARK